MFNFFGDLGPPPPLTKPGTTPSSFPSARLPENPSPLATPVHPGDEQFWGDQWGILPGEPSEFGFEDYDEDDEFGGFDGLGANNFGDGDLADGGTEEDKIDWDFVQEMLPRVVSQGTASGISCAESSKESELVLAAANGDVEKVRKLLVKRGVDVNYQVSETNLFQELYRGDTALLVAASKGHLEVVHVLLAGKADTELANENGETPLLLLACLTEVPLSTPPAYTLASTVTALLTCKADINHEDVSGFTPLMGAVHAGSVELVELCLSRGAFVNHADAQSCTPLMLAARLGHLPVLKLLCGNGARLDGAGSIDVASVNKGAGTCVQLAAAYNRLPVLQYLVGEKKVAPETPLQRQTGSTAAILAASEGHWEAVNCLLDSGGVDVNVQNGHGATLLHYAVKHKQGEIVIRAIESGATVSLKDSLDRTALDYQQADAVPTWGGSGGGQTRSIKSNALFLKAMVLLDNSIKAEQRAEEEDKRKVEAQTEEWAQRGQEVQKQRQAAMLEKRIAKARRQNDEQQEVKVADATRARQRGEERVSEIRQHNAKQSRDSELKERARAQITQAVKSWQDIHSRPLPAPKRLPSYAGYRAKNTSTNVGEAPSPPPSHPHYRNPNPRDARSTAKGGNSMHANANTRYTPRPPPSARPPGRPGSGTAREGRGVGSEQGDGGGSEAVPARPVPSIVRLLRHLHEVFPYEPTSEEEAMLGVIPGRDTSYSFAARLGSRATPSEIKKAYLKAARLVHPDKQRKDASANTTSEGDALEREVLSAEVFALLHAEYRKYLDEHERRD